MISINPKMNWVYFGVDCGPWNTLTFAVSGHIIVCLVCSWSIGDNRKLKMLMIFHVLNQSHQC
jgi:hypothetical protein